MKKYSFDERCLDLARYLNPEWPEAALLDLAQGIQDLCEAEPRPSYDQVVDAGLKLHAHVESLEAELSTIRAASTASGQGKPQDAAP